MRITILSIFLWIFQLNLLFATDWQSILPQYSQEELNTLLSEGSYVQFVESPSQFRLGPAEAVELAKNSLTHTESTYIIEGLFLLPLPQNKTKEQVELEIFNLITAVGTLEGIEYYSASRETMRTFFDEAYAVNNLEDREKQKDKVYSSIPEKMDLLLYTKDLTFGKAVSQMTYVWDGKTFEMKMENLTKMKVAFVTVIQPENFFTQLQIIFTQDHLLVYGAMSAQTLKAFGLEKSKSDSFYYRLIAMADWFKDNYERKILDRD